MSRFRRFPAAPTAIAAALALAGCASLTAPTTRPDAGVAVPSGWATPAEAVAQPPSLAAWWERFGDATLSALVADALAANTDIAAAQAALSQARALADADAARLLPALVGSASAQRSRSNGQRASNAFRAGLDASWEPDLFGRQRSGANASALDAQASAASLGDVQVSIAAEVALAYFTLRGTEQRLAIARDNLALQDETLQIAQWRVQAGLATSLDAEQARASAEQTRAQVPSLETTIAQTRHQLALLTGRTAAQLALPAGTLPQPPADLALAFPADTLRQRADVRRAERQVAAAAQRVVQADAARYASLSLSGSLGLSALTVSGLSGPGAVASSLLAGLSVPLFDGGAAKATVRAQQAAFDAARETHRAAVLGALKDVEDALVALRGDRERVATLERAAEAAGNAALLARQRYASGIVDFQTVLETQRSLLSTQDSVASTRADLAADHVRLYKALGGGWQPEAPAVADASSSTPTR